MCVGVFFCNRRAICVLPRKMIHFPCGSLESIELFYFSPVLGDAECIGEILQAARSSRCGFLHYSYAFPWCGRWGLWQ